MRKLTIALNSFVLVFYVSFLAYTFVARQHLDSLARSFVTEKTIAYSRPVVKAAQEAMDSPLVKKLLSDDKEAAIQNEITSFQNDPNGFVSDLTRQQLSKAPSDKVNPLMEKVAAIKNKIRTFYDDTLDALIVDLRIFSFSNLVAGLLALVMAYRSPLRIRQPLVWFSFLMFVSVIYCSYMYVDDLTFFRILFRAHLGWKYPIILCIVILFLYAKIGRVLSSSAPLTRDKGNPAEKNV